MHEVERMNGIDALSCDSCRKVLVLVHTGVASWVVYEVLVVIATEPSAGGVSGVKDL